MSSDKAKIHPLFAVPDADAAQAETPEREEQQFSAEPSVCQFCFGSGMEVVPGKGARRCRCRTANNQTKLLEAARIPRRYERCTLDSYKLIEGKHWRIQKRAKDYAQAFVNEFPANRGLLFVGSVGVG